MSSDSAFIIYSVKDSDFALDFAKKLNKAGANIWIDTINLTDLDEDQDEEEVMETALLSSKLVIVLTSNDALSDQFVRSDKRFARENDKKMLLVTIEPCDLTKKMRWRNLPVVNLEKNEEDGLQEILGMLNVVKGSEPATKEDDPKITEPKKPKMKQETTSTEMTMLADIKDDIEFYRFKMKEQIRSSKINMRVGIGLAIVILLGAFMIPEFVTAVQEIQDKIQWAGGLIGTGLPTTFSFSSLNSSKEKQKRLDGVQIFEKKILRMERGIIPTTQAELLALEDNFSLYMNA